MTSTTDCIPTLDYEIFGNGLGDVRMDVIEPAHRILSLCNAHHAKMTIFFEVAEYWAFDRYDATPVTYTPPHLPTTSTC